MKTKWNVVTEKRNSFEIFMGEREFLVQKCDFEAFPLDRIVIKKETEFQEVVIADTDLYGRVLFLDGDLQSSEKDESLYHELLVQPAMLAHKEPKDILVVGTGEGASLREIFKHKSASKVVAIDIDQEVVELCRDHLPSWHEGAMNDPRVTHVFKDGFEYLRETKECFDVAIIDIVSDLDEGPAGELYTPEFYKLVKSRLNDNAMVAIQGLVYSPVVSEMKGHLKLRAAVEKVFKHVRTYHGSIPSFLSAWGFILASDWFDPEEVDAQFFEEQIQKIDGQSLKHLNGSYTKAAFALENAVSELING